MEKLPNYLVRLPYTQAIDFKNNYNEIKTQRIEYCTTLDEVIELVRKYSGISTIFKRAGSMGKHWEYFCDASYGVI